MKYILESHVYLLVLRDCNHFHTVIHKLICFCLCYVNTNVYIFLVFEIGRSIGVLSSKVLLCAVVYRYIVCSEMSRDAVQKVVF